MDTSNLANAQCPSSRDMLVADILFLLAASRKEATYLTLDELARCITIALDAEDVALLTEHLIRV